jgi:hypothetical protein
MTFCYLNYYIILAFRQDPQIGSDPTLQKENKRLKENHLMQPKVPTRVGEQQSMEFPRG